MRIGINTLGISPGWGGAEETFLRHLLRELAKFDASAAAIVFTDDDNHTSYDPYQRQKVDKPNALDRAIADAGIDVLLTAADRIPGKVRCPILPYATHLRNLEPGASRGLFGGNPAKAIKSRMADIPVILAASKYLQQQLLQLAEIPLNKIVVAHFGVDPVFSQPADSILERPYILTVGNTNQWKRLDLLLDAFTRIQNEVPFNLASVGRPGDAERENWGDRVFRIDRLPEKHLAGLYQHTEAFVRTAPNDGTALTILESLAAGAMTIAPRTAAIKEIGGNAPIYFNSENLDSLIGVLRRIHQMPEDERARRATLGRQIAQEFTWENTTKQVLKALRRAADGR